MRDFHSDPERDSNACPFAHGTSAESPRGGHGHGGELLQDILAEKPEAQILFVGSVNCLRHKPLLRFGELLRAGKGAILCPSMADFATGRYLHQIRDAIAEIAEERGASEFVLIYSCQWVILSTDGELLQQQVKEELGVELSFVDDSHLEHGDHV